MNKLIVFLKKIFRIKENPDYIKWKIDDIYEQIQGIQQTKMNKVRPIGAKEPLSPEYLIKFHEKRIGILKEMASMNKSQITLIHNNYVDRLCVDCQQEYKVHTTIGTPCEKDFEDYCMMVLASGVLSNGVR